jgi:TolB-like protein/Tfp pilus assembly protein PilF
MKFYASEGKNDTLKISIPKGGYTPDFGDKVHDHLMPEIPHAIASDKRKRPVLAVMPIRNISPDFSHDSFGQELGEYVSTEMARFKELSLIAYSSCESPDVKTKGIVEIGSLLGAEYVLTGSVFIDQKNLRVLLQLNKGNSGKQLWSNAFVHEITATNQFETQEEIVSKVTAAIGGYYGVIYRDVVETSRAGHNREAYSAIVWYDQFLKKIDQNTFDEACEALEDVLKRDSEYALGWAVLSEIYSIGVMMDFFRLDDQIEKAIKFAKRAINLDPLCQHAYQALARAHFFTRNKAEVVLASEKCIALNPRAANFTARIGVFMIYAGEYERGAEVLKQSLKSNPYFPWMSSMALSLYHYQRGEFQESREWAANIDMPQLPWVYLLKVASLGQLGRMEEAKKYMAQLQELETPQLTLRKSYIGRFILDEDLIDKIVSGVEKAGLMIDRPSKAKSR